MRDIQRLTTGFRCLAQASLQLPALPSGMAAGCARSSDPVEDNAGDFESRGCRCPMSRPIMRPCSLGLARRRHIR